MEDNSLEARLKAKLESGQIDHEEFTQLYAKFEKLGMLKKRKEASNNLHIDGAKTITSVDIKGSAIFAGGVTVDGFVKCNTLSTSGSTIILGELIVQQSTSISGEITIDEDVRFFGPSTITGTIRVNDSNLTSSGKLSITGKIFCEDLISDKIINIVGESYISRIKSTDVVNITGSIHSNKIISKEFNFKTHILKSKKSVIDDGILAKTITLEAPIKNFDLNLDELSNFKLDINKEDMGPFSDIISTTVEELVPNVINGIENITDNLLNGLSNFSDFMEIGLIINGDIRGDNIILSHVKILGNVFGDNVKIGSNVEIMGKVHYKNSIDYPKNKSYIILQD